MDFGLAGNMRLNTEEPQLQIASATEATRENPIDDLQINMLELEVKGLSVELEEEKKKSDIERAECAKHLQELEDAEQELLRCQTALQESETQLAKALVENEGKNKELVDAEEELLQCRQRVGDLEKQVGQIAKQNQEEAYSYRVKADKPTSDLAEFQKQRAQHDSTGQQETFASNQMNKILRDTIEDQTRLKIQVKVLEDQVKTLRKELQIAQSETVSKKKEIDIIRKFLRGSEQLKSKEEASFRETKTEMEKNLRIKSSMIDRYTHQIEELQVKAKRIPQLTSQASRLETLNTTLKSQKDALAENMRRNTIALEQRGNELRDRTVKLESALSSMKTETMAMQSRYENTIAEMKVSKDAAEQENQKKTKRAAELEWDIKQSNDARGVLQAVNKKLEDRILHLEKVREEKHSLLGVVFSVDISGSLMGNPEQLAKDVFRKLISDLLSKSPRAHVGVVVHSSSIYVARQMVEVDFQTRSVMDSIPCGGGEDYCQAFIHIVSLLSTFKASYPRAKRCVIMISDGQQGSQLGDVSTLSADGVPCHNIVVNDGFYSQFTEEYSFKTGGRNFEYRGNCGFNDIDTLIGSLN